MRKSAIFAATVLVISAATWGARSAMRSPMFTLQVVEIADQPESSPVSAQEVSSLAALPVGQINLFDLDLKPVEERLLGNPWIRGVRLEKHFPQTLSISLSFREPQAIMQSANGSLAYVDVDGKIFGKLNLLFKPDLPVISSSSAEQLPEALMLIRSWETAGLSSIAQISTLQWDRERGFRVLVTYALGATGAQGRAWVDLGSWSQDLDSDAQLKRLGQVFQYLSSKRVEARQIWADAGKKVVVRTAHGS